MPIVEVNVKSQKGKCNFWHNVGDKIVFDGKSVKGDICYSALMFLLPKVFAMCYGAEFPWAKEKDIASNACPDAENPVVFKIKHIKMSSI